MKIEELSRFETVAKMIGELKLLTRSKNTELTYLKGLKAFLKKLEIKNPDKLVEKIKSGQADANELYKSFAIWLANDNLAPKSVAAWTSAVKKFFNSNGIKVDVALPMKVYTVHEDTMPEKNEIKRALELADIKARVAILILASSGMRVGELHKLRLSDLNLSKDPALIKIKATEAKERKSRITFMSVEAKKALLEYLEKRKIVGHNLDETAPVIARDDGKEMSYQNLQFILSNVFRKVSKKHGKRFGLHAHSLRKWFKTQLITAGVPGPIVDRLMGHVRYLAREYELYTEEQLRNWYIKGMKSLLILT